VPTVSRTLSAFFASVAVVLLAGCGLFQSEPIPDEWHEPSSLRFPGELAEFVRNEPEDGLAENSVRWTYARKGAFCKIAVEPVAAVTGTEAEILAEEMRASVLAHHETLHGELTRGAPEEPFESDATFRGTPLHGMGVVASRDSRGGHWQAALETFVLGGWNVTLITLERDPDKSRPPAPLAACAAAFFDANGS
jgi:hypothetical protein